MNVTQMLEAIATMPKEWRVTSIFSDGKVRILDQPLKGSAEAHAKAQRRFLGKVVANKDGIDITLDSVVVTQLA